MGNKIETLEGRTETVSDFTAPQTAPCLVLPVQAMQTPDPAHLHYVDASYCFHH
jgi:hypothetical protein